MEPKVFAPSEIPENTHLYVIERGAVVCAGRVLTSGKVWGADNILLTPNKLLEKYVGRARAMTYVEVFSISREAMRKSGEFSF